MKHTKVSPNNATNGSHPQPYVPDMPTDDVSVEHVTHLIERIKDDPAILRHPDVQEHLRTLGKSRLDRYLLTQQLERAGLSSPRELWHILDTSEHTVTPRLSFTEAKQLATDEGSERLVENLLVLRGFSILGDIVDCLG